MRKIKFPKTKKILKSLKGSLRQMNKNMHKAAGR